MIKVVNNNIQVTVTLEVGFAIKPTLPSTTGDPEISGFFGIPVTTSNPFIIHNPGRNFTKQRVGNTVIEIGVFVDGTQYR